MSKKYGKIVLGIIEDEKLIEEFRAVEEDENGVHCLVDALADLAARNRKCRMRVWDKVCAKLGIDHETRLGKPLSVNFITGEVFYEGWMLEEEDAE